MMSAFLRKQMQSITLTGIGDAAMKRREFGKRGAAAIVTIAIPALLAFSIRLPEVFPGRTIRHDLAEYKFGNL